MDRFRRLEETYNLEVTYTKHGRVTPWVPDLTGREGVE